MNIGGFLRRNVPTIVLMGSISGCTGAVVYPAFMHAVLNARRSTCQVQLKAIALACLQYQNDYQGKLPPLSDGDSRGWTQLVQTRGASLSFSCPAGYKSSFSPSSDYFFNARLATRKHESIHDPEMTILLGDGLDNGPVNSHYWEVPNDEENPDSVLLRHYGRSNYAFADGHIKSLTPKALKEWWEDSADHKVWHYKFSPDERASRSLPIARKQTASPTPDPATKRLHDLVHAARSFESKN